MRDLEEKLRKAKRREPEIEEGGVRAAIIDEDREGATSGGGVGGGMREKGDM